MPLWPAMRRNFANASRSAVAVQRTIISPSRHRLTRALRSRVEPIRFSMIGLVAVLLEEEPLQSLGALESAIVFHLRVHYEEARSSRTSPKARPFFPLIDSNRSLPSSNSTAGIRPLGNLLRKSGVRVIPPADSRDDATARL